MSRLKIEKFLEITPKDQIFVRIGKIELIDYNVVGSQHHAIGTDKIDHATETDRVVRLEVDRNRGTWTLWTIPGPGDS
jgi:hypothetical protein